MLIIKKIENKMDITSVNTNFIHDNYVYYYYVKNKNGNEYISSRPLLCYIDHSTEEYVFQYMRDVDFMLEIKNKEELTYTFFRVPKDKNKEFIQFRKERGNQSIFSFTSIQIIFSTIQISNIKNKRKVFGTIRGEISILCENYKIEWVVIKKQNRDNNTNNNTNSYYISIPKILFPISFFHSIPNLSI